jgi:ankyrin repeat protein
MAATCGQLAVVELLVNRRADVNAPDYSNKTSIFYARTNEHQEIVELLKKHGAKE